MQYGLFDCDCSTYTEEDAIEAGFYSIEEAQKAIKDRYTEDDELYVHMIEEPEDEEETEDDCEDEE